MPKLEPYGKKLPYSYALGAFPALKLLEYRPESARRLLLRPESEKSEGVALLREKCAALGVREEMAERALERISGKENCFAAVMFEKYDSILSAKAPLHAVLHHISDQGNLGTALRSLLGFGVHDVALVRPCCDPFDPRVQRASMGAFYAMNVRMYDRFEDYQADFPDRTLYPFMLDGSVPLPQAAREARMPATLVFGNEAAGLPPEFAKMGRPVRIPQSSEIDSFNLAIAVSIAAYAFTNREETK